VALSVFVGPSVTGAKEETPATVASTVHEALAAVVVLPAWSVAFTARLCGPSVSEVSDFGEVHGEYEPPSTEQVNVASASPVKEIDAEVLVVNELGAPLRPGATGAVVSTVQVALPALLVLPAWSVAFTARL
jgi:hypothetical protein